MEKIQAAAVLPTGQGGGIAFRLQAAESNLDFGQMLKLREQAPFNRGSGTNVSLDDSKEKKQEGEDSLKELGGVLFQENTQNSTIERVGQMPVEKEAQEQVGVRNTSLDFAQVIKLREQISLQEHPQIPKNQEVEEFQESKDFKVVQESEEPKDPKKVQELQGSKDSKEVHEFQEPKDFKAVQESQEPKDSKKVQELQGSKDSKEVHESQEPKDFKVVQESQEPKDSKEVHEFQESKNFKAVQELQEPKQLENFQEFQENQKTWNTQEYRENWKLQEKLENVPLKEKEINGREVLTETKGQISMVKEAEKPIETIQTAKADSAVEGIPVTYEKAQALTQEQTDAQKTPQTWMSRQQAGTLLEASDEIAFTRTGTRQYRPFLDAKHVRQGYDSLRETQKEQAMPTEGFLSDLMAQLQAMSPVPLDHHSVEDLTNSLAEKEIAFPSDGEVGRQMVAWPPENLFLKTANESKSLPKGVNESSKELAQLVIGAKTGIQEEKTSSAADSKIESRKDGWFNDTVSMPSSESEQPVTAARVQLPEGNVPLPADIKIQPQKKDAQPFVAAGIASEEERAQSVAIGETQSKQGDTQSAAVEQTQPEEIIPSMSASQQRKETRSVQEQPMGMLSKEESSNENVKQISELETEEIPAQPIPADPVKSDIASQNIRQDENVLQTSRKSSNRLQAANLREEKPDSIQTASFIKTEAGQRNEKKSEKNSDNTGQNAQQLFRAMSTHQRSTFLNEVKQENVLPMRTTPSTLVEDLGKTLADRMIKQGSKDSTLTIELEPASLGKLTIKVLYEGGKATVSILSSNAKTLEILNQKAGELASILEERTGQETMIYTQPPQQEAYDERQGHGRQERPDQNEREKKRKGQQESFAQQLRLGLI